MNAIVFRSAFLLGSSCRAHSRHRARWQIEEFFKCLKTGCSMKRRQLTSYEALVRALAIFVPIAWRLLALRALSRMPDPPPADILFDEVQLRVLGHDPGSAGYTASRMSYDLRRLRSNGIVVRVVKSHRYMLRTQGRKIALFMTKSYVRVVRPIFQRLDPQLPEDAPGPLRRAWKACEMEIDKVVTEARLAA